MNALAAEIVAAKDWDELLSVRDQMRRRPSTPHDANHWKFGVSVFNNHLRRHAPARYATQGLESQPSASSVEAIVDRFSWAELDPLISGKALRKTIARERVARGEDLRNAGIKTSPTEPPMRLEPWEPRTYADPIQISYGGTDHDPLPPAGDAITDPQDRVMSALEMIADRGNDISSAKVHGNAPEAIAALGYRSAHVEVMSLQTMLQRVGHDGTFRLGAVPLDTKRRFAWTFLAAVARAFPVPESTPHAEKLRLAGERLRWVSFCPGSDDQDEFATFMRCLAVEDPEAGLAWAMTAVAPVPW